MSRLLPPEATFRAPVRSIVMVCEPGASAPEVKTGTWKPLLAE